MNFKLGAHQVGGPLFFLWTQSELLLGTVIAFHLKHHLCGPPPQVEAVRIVGDIAHTHIVIEMGVKQPATLHFERLNSRRILTITSLEVVS